MKFGIRTPSFKKSISARTTGRAKRAIKKAVIPRYGQKGVGIFADPKKAIYNKVYNNTTISISDILNDIGQKKKYSNEERSAVAEYCQREIDILNDCAKLITSTTNPETFFDRYELYFKKLVCLAEAEQRKLIHLDGDSPSEALKKFDTDSVRISMINDFIDRMWKDCCKHADSLKTERGKTNAINRFYSTLAKYNERMYQSNIDYYTSKKYPIFRG